MNLRKWYNTHMNVADSLCSVSLKELMPLLEYLMQNDRIMLDEWEEDHANGKIYMLV